MNEFDDPNLVASYVSQMKQADILRAADRTLIQNAANGFPPYSQQEALDNGIEVNVNWGFMARLCHRARRQYENAMTKQANYFTVRLDDAPVETADEWGRIITKEINKVMKNSLSYLEVIRSVFAGVVLHGIGPRIWSDEDKWEPQMVAIEDVLLPTGTLLTMKGTSYFATRAPYTYLEIANLIRNEKKDPGWNDMALRQLLDTIKPTNGPQNNLYSWTDTPEKMWEVVKQNKTYWDYDSVPQIWVWNFFHQGEDKKWHRKVILDTPGSPTASVVTSDGGATAFLYKSPGPVADSMNEIIHFQFGDGSNKPPFMYHSVRSLGYLLYDTTEMMNRVQSTYTQHVMEQMTTLFRVNDPGDRARASEILLNNKGIVPDGVSFVTPNERYAVNANIVQGLQGNFRQIISESAAAFTADVNDGTQKEMTATEIMARVNDVNSLIASMLVAAYNYERFADIEICRRFCKKDSSDKEVKEFQERCKKRGVPEKWLDHTRWTITPEMVLGGGHKMLELAQSRELMGMAPQLDPSAQDMIRRMHITALTDNPDLADKLVPETKPKTSFSKHDAEIAFGAMMSGSPVQPAPGLNRVEQLTTILELMQLKVGQIEQEGNVGTRQDVIGLSLALNYSQQLVQQLAPNKQNETLVKEASKVLADIDNKLKGFAQRQMEEEQKAQQQPDPVEVARLQIDQQRAQMQMQNDMERMRIENQRAMAAIETANRKMMADIEAKNAAVQAEIQRKDAAVRAEIARQDALAAAEMQRGGMETASGIAMDGAKTEATIQQGDAKTNATIRQGEKKTDASIEAQRKTADAQAKLTTKKKAAKKPSDA